MAKKPFVTPIIEEGIVAREFSLNVFQSFVLAQKISSLKVVKNFIIDVAPNGMSYTDEKTGNYVNVDTTKVIDDIIAIQNFLSKMCPKNAESDMSIFDSEDAV